MRDVQTRFKIGWINEASMEGGGVDRRKKIKVVWVSSVDGRRMNPWVDARVGVGQKNRWKEVLTEGQVDGRKGGRTEGQMDDRRTDGRTGRRTENRWTDGRADRRTNGQTGRRVDSRTDG